MQMFITVTQESKTMQTFEMLYTILIQYVLHQQQPHKLSLDTVVNVIWSQIFLRSEFQDEHI